MGELLEVVNEKGNTIGLETRKKIHRKGLLHREVNVWFLTVGGDIIFQHRSRDKDLFPDKLDATVGGHVEPGMTYLKTVKKETLEETGIKIKKENLFFIEKIRERSISNKTNFINNTIRAQYVYLYKGNIEDLKIEIGKSEGFESWGIKKLTFLSHKEKERFIMTDNLSKFFKKVKIIFLKL